ncbi:hypothetical protein SERLA73DRAFT_186822 [Serpula lacrymans var. lacrymans S7.3]|uniref:Rhodopsin domain-containing protein n=2 Tax=Serpula lacrymans var. lacrymans TaxID=341189 RepID=F8Q7X9_SERL3|nr:uncharacterized protein SERLADRAFT_476071 [Serpula lacrymans var. lacrymans S7.9]EGN95667.1 hypothetical protein SERLA73DRAFT_186822 [Serpula lacrymans var. lacrymans S7.3]EGO21194.1 hypothetical protein SERLADRAFT_476071 [Serpula lacrymans var. lacrymans S7.9]
MSPSSTIAVVASRAVQNLRIVTSVLQGLAISLTVFRLWYRIRLQRAWWEDGWAAIALLWGTLFLIADWVYLTSPSGNTSLAAYWVYMFSFTCVLWAVRMSLVFSVVRMMSPSPLRRRLAFGIGGLFAMMWVGLLVQKVYMCGHIIGWHKTCHLMRPMVIVEVGSDCISDTILVVIPLRLLWHVNLPRQQRRMILSLFSSSIVISLGSILHAAAQITCLYSLIGPASNFEVALSMIVCNLLVAVTSVYRVFRDELDMFDGTSEETRDTSAASQLTSIDLNHLTSEMTQGWTLASSSYASDEPPSNVSNKPPD